MIRIFLQTNVPPISRRHQGIGGGPIPRVGHLPIAPIGAFLGAPYEQFEGPIHWGVGEGAVGGVRLPFGGGGALLEGGEGNAGALLPLLSHVFAKALPPSVPAKAWLLVPPKSRRRVEHVVGVDPHRPRLDVFGEL